MTKHTKLSKQIVSIFDLIRKIDENGEEYWSAREFSKALEYADYRNFIAVLNKAKEACANSGQKVENHFVDVNEMVSIGYGVERQVDSVKLSRYACYLIVQNGNPAKEAIALGQTYFAIQTRLQEIQQSKAYNALQSEEERRLYLRKELSWHNSQLAGTAHHAGVIDNVDYAVFQNFGYMGLYGGLDAKDIHAKKKLKKNQKILDHMGSTELAANLFRTTQTEEKLRIENIKGKEIANQTHYEIGAKVRKTIREIGSIMPENLPATESIKNIERRLKGEQKKIKQPAQKQIVPKTIEINVKDYYGIPTYYAVMPPVIFNALEYAFLNKMKTAVVNRDLFEQMIENYKQKKSQY